VAKGKQKGPSYKQPQKYDTSFKKWISQQAHEILPLLVPGAEYTQMLEVEVAPDADAVRWLLK
jgi:hypothetical protein